LAREGSKEFVDVTTENTTRDIENAISNCLKSGISRLFKINLEVVKDVYEEARFTFVSFNTINPFKLPVISMNPLLSNTSICR
jgi:hypothetical protein